MISTSVRHTRRDFLRALGLGTAALALPGLIPSCGKVEARPNIILIMADDLGYGDLGCYGSTTIRTPHLDALAGGGMRFTDFHSNGPVCSPTRAALLTGRYQQRCGIDHVFLASLTRGHHEKPGLALEEVTFAEVLKTEGYKTGLFGKWHLGYPVEYNPTHQGFDEFRGYVSGNVDYHSRVDGGGMEDWWDKTAKIKESGYVTDLITEHAVSFIKRHKDRPFLLYVPHEAPHYPYQGRGDKPFRFPGKPNPGQGVRDDWPGAYKEMIEVMDEGIGRIVETVRLLGLERQTFIFFCSDNGAKKPGSNGPLAGYKGSLWEGGHRVPAIAYWPGKVQPGTVSDETTMTMDLFPTLLALTGASAPAEVKLDGVNILPVLLEGKKIPGRQLFWSYERRKDQKEKVVREGPWKLYIRGGERHLFNLAEDLGEQNNLAAADPERAGAMEVAFARWYEEVTAGVTWLC